MEWQLEELLRGAEEQIHSMTVDMRALENKIEELEGDLRIYDATVRSHEELLRQIQDELEGMIENYPLSMFAEKGLIFHSIAQNLIDKIREALDR